MIFSEECMENPKLLSPLTLAFIGDGVYELMVRERLVKQANVSANALHKKAVTMVRASAQSRLYELLEPILSEEELSIMKRGRNANSTKAPKKTNPVEYRRATGVETLFGYLYLSGKEARLKEIFDLAMTIDFNSIDEKIVISNKEIESGN
ncbi:MAG: ribonuclease III domain-containing protein [Oscillospiraceae bacterium]